MAAPKTLPAKGRIVEANFTPTMMPTEEMKKKTVSGLIERSNSKGINDCG